MRRFAVLLPLLAACSARAPEPLPEPPAPEPPPPPAIATHPTAWHTCMLDAAGVVVCWGRNDDGQLGVAAPGALRARHERTPRVEMVTVGGRHTCALDRDGVVYCWGANDHGQLGDGDTISRARPESVGTERRFARVSAGEEHTCALDGDGRAFCWGDNARGQLGDGSRTATRTPAAVRTDATFIQLSAGARHTCGVTTDARLLCWGDNFLGQLGLPGSVQASATPVEVLLEDSVASVSAGHGHTCAVAVDGVAWCWGQNGIGQLGTGAPPGTSGPAPIQGTPPLADLRVGYHHTCAVDVNGAGWCWGANTAADPGDARITGQLGASVSWTNLPIRIERLVEPLDALAAGAGHTCALTRTGAVYCFGSNRYRQLGVAQPGRSVDPIRIPLAP